MVRLVIVVESDADRISGLLRRVWTLEKENEKCRQEIMSLNDELDLAAKAVRDAVREVRAIRVALGKVGRHFHHADEGIS
jgi:cell division protein FtsB